MGMVTKVSSTEGDIVYQYSYKNGAANQAMFTIGNEVVTVRYKIIDGVKSISDAWMSKP